jgi:hypothetical protein
MTDKHFSKLFLDYIRDEAYSHGASEGFEEAKVMFLGISEEAKAKLDRISNTPFLIADKDICDEFSARVKHMNDGDYVDILTWFRDHLRDEDLDRVTMAILYAKSGKWSEYKDNVSTEPAPF